MEPPPQSSGDGLRNLEREAIAYHARTGVTHCLVKPDLEAPPVILPEPNVVAAGIELIDCILWSTDVSETDGLDPALLA